MTGGGHADTWTAPMVKRLTELHAENLPFSVIADRLNEEFMLDPPISRNACIGKGRRLNLTPREAQNIPMTVREQQRRLERRRAKAEKRIPPPPPSYEPLPPIERPPPDALTMLDLKYGDCRWPHGEHPNLLYCGRPVLKRSYCFKHFRQAYVKPGKTWE